MMVLKKYISIPDRTLRCWLAQFVQEGVIRAIGEGKGRKYGILQQLENKPILYRTEESHPIFTAPSAILLAHVQAPIIKREPCSYHEEWLHGYIPNQTFYLGFAQRQMLYENGKRLNEELPAGTYAQKVFNRLLIDLSYNSARLEGNTYSLLETDKRTARLAANIPLVQHNLVPLSFNDISQDDYIAAILVIYELNQITPLAELYIWSYLRTCKQYTVTALTLGIEPVPVFYRVQRRQLIAEIVHNLVCEPRMSALIKERAYEIIPEEDRQKFIEDVENDLSALASFTIAGMGIYPLS